MKQKPSVEKTFVLTFIQNRIIIIAVQNVNKLFDYITNVYVSRQGPKMVKVTSKICQRKKILPKPKVLVMQFLGGLQRKCNTGDITFVNSSHITSR